jgi:hypothetical protein
MNFEPLDAFVAHADADAMDEATKPTPQRCSV